MQHQPPPSAGGFAPARRFRELRREIRAPRPEAEDPPSPEQPRRTLHPYRGREILTRAAAPDLPFDRSLNPYRGCEHGCVYCCARPTHAYLGLSPGLDFETEIFAKYDAAARLAESLSRPSYRPAPIMIGTVTDPYQPAERDLGLMRPILEILLKTRHPAMIATKSAMILRDLDLLAEMARLGLVAVGVSLATLERRLARAMEPRASSPQRRLAAMAALSGAGVPVTTLAAPVIMGFNDHELEAILKAGAAAGARFARYQPLRLPGETRAVFDAWLDERFPERAASVKRAVAAMEAHRFGERLTGRGAAARLLAQRFALATRRHGLGATPELRVDRFRRPLRRGDRIGFFDRP